MQSAFQPGAFQASGFQIVAAVQQQGGGYGWGAYDHEARRRKKRKEILEEIEREREQADALEALIAKERNVPVAAVRLETAARIYGPLPKPARKVVERALEVPTIPAIERAFEVLRRLEDEEEEFAVLMSLAMH